MVADEAEKCINAIVELSNNQANSACIAMCDFILSSRIDETNGHDAKISRLNGTLDLFRTLKEWRGEVMTLIVLAGTIANKGVANEKKIEQNIAGAIDEHIEEELRKVGSYIF